ncbi:sigma-70 family RNA polymerase sigma factor [Streptacidiphilus fuscans]|uniref:Sigma-70 family RNA polymerase sigma factor n=1 Tax=Streptacidiphilus fuscans TaxID=2789292 RepID=A0A931B8I1_9ACTN|nr:sigma-70 family RNA polymerase sigma factor [Streptacidiphilus fuscans]MBF9071452.1 sigma-70 family RNA polymerase sigma factor [Streptacidiphilus fuscans]
MTDNLLQRARSGDRDAFAALVEPYRGELQLHCYRMLGSLQDAEDTLQEVLLAAWMGLEGFEGRSSVRTWLHRIATNRCLNALRTTRRQVPAESAVPSVPRVPSGPSVPSAAARPEPSRLGEVLWLQPFPDLLLDGLPDQNPGPEARYESREAVSLAFVTAVQVLPPNQRAVLILRDVLGYRAAETAELLGLTESAVTSALKRARATMEAVRSDDRPDRPALAPGSPEEQELADRFVAAFTGDDVSALVALMTDDAWVRMPPLPFEYHGTEAIARFFSATEVHPACPVARMLPTRANGQPAWGLYVRDTATGVLHGAGVLVAAFSPEGVSALTHFETTVAPWFGLPRTAPELC